MRPTVFAAVAALMFGIPAFAAETDPADLVFWESVKDSKNPVEFKAYLKAFPDGRFAELARIRAGLSADEPIIGKTTSKDSAGGRLKPGTGSAGGAAFAVNEKVEALSTSGWQPATIVELGAGEALVHYDAPGVADERLDLQLIRKPKGKPESGVVVAKPGGDIDPGTGQPPDGGDGVAKGKPGAKGSQPATEVAAGDYACSLDLAGFTFSGQNEKDSGISIENRITITINDDNTYNAFNYDSQPYSFDAVAGTIVWDGGVLQDMGGPGQYQPGEGGSKPSIVVDFNGQKLTCTLE